MIPFVAVVSLRNQESHTFRLWIPLVLIWLLLLPLGWPHSFSSLASCAG